jgi:hypothetical protein
MNLAYFKNTKFLQQRDVGAGVLVTINRVTQENIAIEGAEPEHKIAIYFDELDKPLICNSTNAQLIAQITKQEENVETGWVGAKVVLYTDPNVSFQGKLTGGIRVRAPKSQIQQAEQLPF